ncbi:cat eye syndrome critical region protein 2-like isoform X3 [Rhincodon typus]|uniref:cat eye syndrome critical region protein 2-like isoform X3 n=1 Tax=Rhincodon typus TaxID=259920 RepID=UPI00202ED039|nr:cat eye syndrome critical region protein 2-like isoform X3 [Rhincodon typus]
MAQPGCVRSRGRVSVDKLRSWWEVPAIAHFCSLFRAAFSLPDFEIEEFEDALLVDNWEFLEDLVSKLLRGCYQRKDISIENFHVYLEDIIRHRWELEEGKENPLEGIHFRALSTRVIIEILHKLCDYRLDATDVFDLLKGLEADSLRVEPLGEDSVGARYWYFYGTRLYKELPPPKPPKETSKPKAPKNDNKKGKKLKEEGKTKNFGVMHKNIATKSKDEKQKKKWKLRYSLSKTSDKFERVEKESGIIDGTSDEESNMQKENGSAGYSDSSTMMHLEEWSTWSLVCHTLEEWQRLADGFRESQCSKERKLYKILTENFIPEISNLIVQKEKQLQKKYAEIVPRRASDRLLVKRTQQEELRQTLFGQLGEKGVKDGFYLAAQRLYTPQEIKRIEEEGKILARQERARRRQLREERQMSYVKSTLKRKCNPKAPSPAKHEEPIKKRPEVHYTDDEEYVSMYKVLDTVKGHKDSWPFNEPVDESYAPGYHKIIEEPMDLSTIENKLSKKKYSSKWAFESDFRLMFDNCEQYNGKGNEYTQMARAVERCFNKAMAKYFPKDEVDSDDDFQAKMMWEKKDKHKSKLNHLANDETEILTETTDHVCGTHKVNGFVNSRPTTNVPHIIADSSKKEGADQQLCNKLPLPSQMQIMEEKKNSASSPHPCSEVIHQSPIPRVPERIVMEPIRKRFQQQYRMQQQMLMNGPITPASVGPSSTKLQTVGLSSDGHGDAPLHTGMPADPVGVQAPKHSPVCKPNRSANLGLQQTRTETLSSHAATAVPMTHGNREATVQPHVSSGDCHVADINQTKAAESPGYLNHSSHHPQDRLPEGQPNPMTHRAVSMENASPVVQTHLTATSNSISKARSPVKNETLPNACGISVQDNELHLSQPNVQTSDFNLDKSPSSPLDQTPQRAPVKGVHLDQTTYNNLFSTDQHYLVNKEPTSNKVTSLNTSAANLLQQDTTRKSTESERLGGILALKKQKLFQSNEVGEKDSEGCKLREEQNLLLSNSLTTSGKQSMRNPKSTENLRLKLANNAGTHSNLPNCSGGTIGSVQHRNPAMLVARPDTRHQFGSVPAYLHYVGCNPENLASAHSFVQHAPHLMVVHPIQGQGSHLYQHPMEQQLSSHMNNIGYHPQQSIQSAVMPDRSYLAGQPGLYNQSPLLFLREGSGQSQAILRERTDMYSEHQISERNECKPVHEASIQKQKSEALERVVVASKIENNGEASTHGRSQDYLDFEGQTATKRQKVIHSVSATYNTSQITSGIYSHQIPHPALYANAPSHNVQRLPYGQTYNPQLLRVRSVITSTSNHVIPHQVMNQGPFGMQLLSHSDMKPNSYPGTVIVQRPPFNTSGDLYMMRNLLPDYPVLKHMGRRDPDTMPQPQDKVTPTPCMNQP